MLRKLLLKKEKKTICKKEKLNQILKISMAI